MLIVYRKSDKEILNISSNAFVEPQGMSDENGKLAVIEQIGGTFDDYGTYRLHDVEDEVKVNEIMKYQGYVSLVFDGEDVVNYSIDFSKYESDQQAIEEQKILDSLIPSEKEVMLAEAEIQTITILSEVGLI